MSRVGNAISGNVGLRCDLSDTVAEPIFSIARLVKAARHQRFDCELSCGSTNRSHTYIPTRKELDVGRQTCVYEALCVGDRPLVKSSDPSCECLYKRI